MSLGVLFVRYALLVALLTAGVADAMEGGLYPFLISGGFRPGYNFIAKYIVSIRTSRPTEYLGDNHFCCGTIISSRLVLTAAHCVIDSNKIVTRPHRLSIIAGAPNRLLQNGVKMSVEAVFPHERFVRRGSHDIAMLRLTEPIPDDNDLIKILPLASVPPQWGMSCTVGGWGQIFYKGPYSAEPIFLNLTIQSDRTCMSYYPTFYTIGMLCAFDSSDLEADACRGDSGAPLICNGHMAGLISWGMRCGTSGYPTVFTDVFYYRMWLQGVNRGPRSNGALGMLLLLPLVLVFN